MTSPSFDPFLSATRAAGAAVPAQLAEAADAAVVAPGPTSVCTLPLRAGGLDASVQQLEQRSFNAWPGVRSAVMGDWLLRSSGGYTKRANSANALQPGATLDAAALQHIEAWYAAQQLPCIFRLSPLADAAVDGLLAQRGYAWVEASRMLQLRISVAEAGNAGGAGLQWLAGQPALSFQVQPQCSDVWRQGCCRANGIAAAQQQ